jgi:predicted Fe-S protein YdhL (DUF1289 family)
LIEAMIPGPCQVRSRTESPCLRSAEVEILGVAFCGPCAREQEAYFAIGELTQEEAKGLLGMSLTEVLERKRRERTGGTGNAATEMHHGLSDVCETKPLALNNS